MGRNPFYAMFTFALVGIFLAVTGAIRWRVGRFSGLSFPGSWTDGPVWSQIGMGAAFLGLAAVFYRIASRDPRLRH
jgi:hypothetical protein